MHLVLQFCCVSNVKEFSSKIHESLSSNPGYKIASILGQTPRMSFKFQSFTKFSAFDVQFLMLIPMNNNVRVIKTRISIQNISGDGINIKAIFIWMDF